MWYRVVAGGGNEGTITFTAGNSPAFDPLINSEYVQMVALEFSGSNTSPLTDQVKIGVGSVDDTPAAGTGVFALPSLSLDGSTGQMVVACVYDFPPGTDYYNVTANAGYTFRYGKDPNPFLDQSQMAVIDKTGLSGAGSQTIVVNNNGIGGKAYVGMAAAFKKA
jgi:hypothetical protein